MKLSPPEKPLPDEVEQLRMEAFHHAQEEWDGWNAIPLTPSQMYQVVYIINKLIGSALQPEIKHE